MVRYVLQRNNTDPNQVFATGLSSGALRHHRRIDVEARHRGRHPAVPELHTDSPQASWTRTRYGGSGTMAQVEAISIAGGPHNNGWSLAFTIPSGQTITSGWNASYSPASGQVAARNVSYNATIAPNGSVGIGFQARHAGNTGRPSSFALNGAACLVA